MRVVHPALLAQIQPANLTPDYSMAWMVPIYATAIITVGIVFVMAIAVRNTTSQDRADVIRALGDFFRALAELIRSWFRGGPPGVV